MKIKKSKFNMKKYMGDDKYSWAIFKDGFPYLTGLSKPEASYYLKKHKKKEENK